MALVTLRVAAELTGKDRSTLNRAIENGKLSATKNDLGRYLIDPAELERVYGTLRAPAVHSNAPPEDAQSESSASSREVELLRELLESERAAHARERGAFDRDRRTWEEQHARLLGLVEKHTDQIKLLTDQRERETERRTWLARWLGRRSPAPSAQ
jgi:hypothetical protein